MRRARMLIAAAALAAALPSSAQTAVAPRPPALGVGPFHWDFEAPGKMHDLVEKVLRVAWTFMPLALIVALAVEAFGHSPGLPRDFSTVVWRVVLVVFLLLFYVPLFNGLMKHVFDPLADAVTPVSGLGEFLRQSIEAAKGLPSSQADQVIAEGGVTGAATAIVQGAGFGGFFYDSLVSLLLLVAEGLTIVLGKLGKLLAALLFCIGPLALVAAVPRPSRTGTRWFSHFVTILSWPIFSGLLLSILVAMGRDGSDTGGYLGAIVASLITAGMALVIPRLAYHIVGGTLENLIASGWNSAKAIQREATSPVVRDAMRGVVGGPVRNREGSTEWQPGVPQRIATVLGSTVMHGLRPQAIDPAAAARAAPGPVPANPPVGGAAATLPKVPATVPGSSPGPATPGREPAKRGTPPAISPLGEPPNGGKAGKNRR
jgi:hypothetical protein